MIKATLIAAGLTLALPAIAMAQTSTSATPPDQPGASRSMNTGSGPMMKHSDTNPGMAMSTGAGRSHHVRKHKKRTKHHSM